MELTLAEALQKGIDAHKAGRAKEADQYYTAILKAQPNHPDANHNIGILAVELGKVEEAIHFFKTAVEANPKIVQFWLSYVDSLVKLDRSDTAKFVLQEAKRNGVRDPKLNELEQKLEKADPSSSTTHPLKSPPIKKLESIANLYSQGKNKQTLEETIKLLKKFPDSAILYNILGAANKGLGKLDKALDAYDKAIALKPDYSEALNNLGVILQIQGRLDEAINAYKKAISFTPDYAEAFNNMGNTFKDQGKLDDAIDAYEKAIVLKPNYTLAYNNIGVTFKDKGTLDEAINAYDKAIALKPDYFEALNNLGVILQIQGKLDEAINAYKKAIEVKPNYALAFFNTGNILHKQGKLDEAIDAFRSAISFNPDYAQANINMGNVLKEQGKLDEAIEAFNKANTKLSTAQGLECLYHQKKYDVFHEKLKNVARKDPMNLRVAAISAFASNQMRKKDPYPFCPDPIKFITFSNIKKHVPDYQKFIGCILDEMDKKHATWEPESKTTKGGFQTNNKLFEDLSPIMEQLKKILNKELNLFKTKFNEKKNILIKKWPKEINYNAWFVRLLKSGHQEGHIHPAGWVSGVIYLKTVEDPHQSEGAIEFGLHGYDYPIKNKSYPQKIYQPKNGDIVLFPSSLFHRTIPVIKDVERCVIAFDLLSDNV